MPRFYALLTLLSFPLTFSGCGDKGKDDPPAPAPSGTIIGSIASAGAIASVSATSASGTVTTATPVANSDGKTARYTLANLAAGTYTVAYTPAPRILAPAPKQATVTANQTTDLGSLATQLAPTPTISCTHNGKHYATTYSSGLFFPPGKGFLAFVHAPTNPNAEIYFYFGVPFKRVGTYTYPYISTGYRLRGDPNLYNNAPRVGSVQITAIDTVSMRASGTFSFELDRGQVITDGKFTDLLFEY